MCLEFVTKMMLDDTLASALVYCRNKRVSNSQELMSNMVEFYSKEMLWLYDEMIREMGIKTMRINLDFMVIKQARNNDYLTYNINTPGLWISSITQTTNLFQTYICHVKIFFLKASYRNVDLMSQPPFVSTVVNCPRWLPNQRPTLTPNARWTQYIGYKL
jgi:hypothetical protein